MFGQIVAVEIACGDGVEGPSLVALRERLDDLDETLRHTKKDGWRGNHFKEREEVPEGLFDEYEGLRGDGLQDQQWYFQFSIGQGFGL